MRSSLARRPTALALAAVVAGSACVELAVAEADPASCPAGERRDDAGACAPLCDARPWFRDRDRDGHGLGEAAGQACELPAEGAWEAGDCVDEPPGPGEEADPRLESAAFVDADLDGFGAPGQPALGCDPLPPGLSRTGDDCDDGAAAVHPDSCGRCVPLGGPALEGCGADGSCSACGADLVLRGAADDRLGEVAVGDFDGDGQDDLAVAGPDHLNYSGVIHVLFGPLGEGVGLLDEQPGSIRLVAPGELAGVGYSLASPGDLDGDGAAELFVGTASWDRPDGNNAGTASLVPGRALAEARALGLRQLPLLGEVGAAALVLRESPLDRDPVVLRVAAAAADLTGDGRPDLVVAGEGGVDPLRPELGRVGAAFVVPGCLAGAGLPATEVELSAAPVCTLDGALARGAAFYGAGTIDGNPLVTALPADLDGQPPLDLVVLVPAQPGTGAELVGLFGRLQDRLSSAGALTVRPAGGGHLRAGAALPDLDGDGFPELAVTELSATAPRLHVLYGPFAPGALDLAAPGAVRVVTRESGPTGTFGENVSSAGDLDGDSIPELLVTEGGFSDVEPSQGRVLIYRGASLLPGAAAEAPVRLEGPPEGGAQLGRSIAAAGDLNGDGFLDVVVTARMEESLRGGGTLPGAYVFYGPLGGR